MKVRKLDEVGADRAGVLVGFAGAAADAFARQTLDPLRDGQTFGDAVEAAPDASPIERLARYTGRR